MQATKNTNLTQTTKQMNSTNLPMDQEHKREKTARMDGRALACLFGLPTSAVILKEIIPPEQLQQIYNQIGEKDLLRIINERAKLSTGNNKAKAAEVEEEHLRLISGPIEEAISAKLWLTGHASEFAESLLKIVNPAALIA